MKVFTKKALAILLSVLMTFSVMAICAVSTSAATLAPGEALYLKPNANWITDGARFAAYFFGAGDKWVSMTDSDGDGYYETVVPEGGYTSVIFCRMSGTSTTNSWSTKWNQTDDLTLSADYNCYTVKENTWDNGGGQWSKIWPNPPTSESTEPTQPKETEYYVAGTMNNWTLSDEAYKMTKTSDGIYTYTIASVPTSTDGSIVRFKVNDGTWVNAYPSIDYEIPDAVGKECVITFNATTKEVVATYATEPTKPVATYEKGINLYLTPNSNWLKDDARFVAYFCNDSMNMWVDMTDNNDDGVYEVMVPTAGFTTVIFCRMDPNNALNSWDTKWDQTGDITPDETGLTCYVIAESADNWTEGKWSEYTVFETTAPTDPQEVNYYIASTMNDWNPCDENYMMTQDGENMYKFVIPEVTLNESGEAKFKVTSGTWNEAYPADNYDISAAQGREVTIIFDAIKKTVIAEFEKPEEPTFEKDIVLYLTPNSNWVKDGARFATYFCNDNTDEWVDMTDENADGVYEVTVPAEGYTKVIFCRMDGSSIINNWETKWDQTGDITPDETGLTCYVITQDEENWTEGKWDEYTIPETLPTEPQEVNYYVASTMNDWNPCDENCKMVDIGDGMYEFIIDYVTLNEEGVAAFKVTTGTWEAVSYPAEDYDISDAEGKDVTILFDSIAKTVIADYSKELEKTYVAGTILYLTPNSNWVKDGARFAARFMNNEEEDWSDMTDRDGDGVYEVAVPADGYTMVAFYRMDPDNSDIMTAMWNSTEGLVPNEEGLTCYVLYEEFENWDGYGQWSEYTLPQVVGPKTYTIVGYINGADVGCGLDDKTVIEAYNFVDGKVTITFTNDENYIFVKTTDNKDWYMFDDYCVDIKGILRHTSTGVNEKMFVPAGTYTFTLGENEDGTLTISYKGEKPSESSSDSSSSSETEPTETESTETKPTETEPTETESTETEPTETESTETKPTETEPTETESTETEPTETEPTETDPTETEPTETESTVTDPVTDPTTDPTPPQQETTAPMFVVSNEVAKVGETVAVKVSIKENTGIVSAKIKVSYDDTKLELISAEEREFKDVSYGEIDKNPFIVNWVDAISPNNKTNGDFVVLTFKVKENAAAGNTKISVSYNENDVYDYGMNNVYFNTIDGGVNILRYVPGDLNDDGKTNNKDLGLLQRILNGYTIEINELAADVNRDGMLDNKDYGILQRYLNGWDVVLA